jgi:alpha-methylacyl-CoA racemase
VDAAIVDGVSVLAQMMWSLIGQRAWVDEPQQNLLDGGAPFYDTYTCADGQHLAVGALEPQFYAALLHGLGLDPAELPAQDDRAGWPILRSRLAERFATRTRDEWAEVFADTDACVTPVLSFQEAAGHPHLVARATIVPGDGGRQAAPAPRFSRTPTSLPPRCAEPEDVEDLIGDWQ